MRSAAIFVAAMGLIGSTSLMAAEPAKPRLSGPFTHANLTLFLIHGPDSIPGRTFVTLQEALERKIIVVHETSNVNMLSIENTSTDVEVFVMAGDVVKGGKQDRAIAFDQIIPPKSGKLPLPSFCVEHGRWRKRGAESEAGFAASNMQVVGKGMKIALNESRQQGEVWKEVAEAQKRLSENVGKPVQSAASPSSLQLCLEDKELNEKLAKYQTPLADILKDKNDVIGVVAIVNGEVSGADAFCSADLFRKLWPKLLKSAGTEALAEVKPDKKFELVKIAEVEAFLTDAAKGDGKEVSMNPAQQHGAQTMNASPGQNAQHDPLSNGEIVNATQTTSNGARAVSPPPPPTAAAKVRVLKFANAKSLLLECQEKDRPSNVVHRCYIAK